MKQNTPISLLIAFSLLSGCSKTDPHFTPVTPPPVVIDSAKPLKCHDFTLADSTGYGRIENFIFDSLDRLVSHKVHIVYDSTHDYTVSFIYENGNMVKSYMYLGSNNPTIPYTTSTFGYNGNTLATSRYYLGNLLLVHSEYSFDSSGRLSTYAQYADNSTYQYQGNYVVHLNYNGQSDMIALTNAAGDSILYCMGFDSHPNPFRGLQFDFAYDVPHYFIGYFSQHNYQELDDYFSGVNRWLYNYTYDEINRVAKIATWNNFDVNAPVAAGTMLLTYRCAP